MTDSPPLYRIVYANGQLGARRSWTRTLNVLSRHLAELSPASRPVRVEQVR